ncbi:hypothetical protein PEDI_47730 [Persicobacter diffluens]|uniref:Uncharacterized protein n=1 Tax=Persicobacter diffluens TaxID=981 RepID=A0AAN4W202_9BACT|nr:hypothetical protein PEDI_47730 [Persicobacter diffluens]
MGSYFAASNSFFGGNSQISLVTGAYGITGSQNKNQLEKKLKHNQSKRKTKIQKKIDHPDLQANKKETTSNNRHSHFYTN